MEARWEQAARQQKQEQQQKLHPTDPRHSGIDGVPRTLSLETFGIRFPRRRQPLPRRADVPGKSPESSSGRFGAPPNILLGRDGAAAAGGPGGGFYESSSAFDDAPSSSSCMTPLPGQQAKQQQHTAVVSAVPKARLVLHFCFLSRHARKLEPNADDDAASKCLSLSS